MNRPILSLDFDDEPATYALDSVRFPRHKPPAFLTLDDRTLRFDGSFPVSEELLTFKPWWDYGRRYNG